MVEVQKGYHEAISILLKNNLSINIKTSFYISVHLLDIGPLTFTDDTEETTLIGILSGNGDETSCKGTTAFGRVSYSDTLNWIKQQIEKY